MLTSLIEGEGAWSATTTLPGDGIVRLEHRCLAEVRSAVQELRANPLETVALSSDDFALDACRDLMTRIKAVLDDGAGFVVLDRLPIEEFTSDESKAAQWLLMSLLGRTVAQTWTGTLIYDVEDTGKKEELGAGVRGSKTNGRQGYHTDNSYNLPPDYVALLCLRTARSGGRSGLVSFSTVHNRLLETDPESLKRLYEPFYFERYKEFAPGESSIASHPVFAEEDGRLAVRLSTGRIRMGYKAAAKALDERGEHALSALDRVLEDPDLGRELSFEPGQMQVVNNRRIGHRRTAFEDWPEQERRRHLVRVWVRNQGRRFYAG